MPLNSRSSIELPVRTSNGAELLEGPAEMFRENDEPMETNDIVVQQLKPADSGLPAWTVLIAAFIFEALLWGRDILIFCLRAPDPSH
ncbi:hypothetical protein H2198_003371, partial [Neophaeococcomyces mojaviensis]